MHEHSGTCGCSRPRCERIQRFNFGPRRADAAGRRRRRQEGPDDGCCAWEFDVKLALQQDEERFAAGRRTIDKQFRGDLEASSLGQMLSWLNASGDSGGYVAIERVTGTLHGRKGSFVLQHSSTALRGAQQQHITVVPGSGDGDLAGLAGTMTIQIKDGKHFYEFSYRF